MYKTSEIREKLIIKRAQYEQSLAANEANILKMQEIIKSIDEEKIELLSREGYKIREALDIDFEKIKTDPEYNALVRRQFKDVITLLRPILEEMTNA